MTISIDSVDIARLIESYLPLFLAALCIMPPIFIWLNSIGVVPDFWVRVSPLLFLIIPIIFLLYVNGDLTRSVSDSESIQLESLGIDSEQVQILYPQMNEEIRYRDKLAVNASYFSLATLALLANLLNGVGPRLRPLIAVLGMFVALGFSVTIEQKVMERDELRQMLKELEKQRREAVMIQNRISSIASKRFFYPLNLSKHIIDFHRLALLLWIATYVIITLNQAWDLF